MGLLAPLALIGLVSVPIIVAFYMLRLRRPERPVSSTFLWQQLVRDVEANAPWQKLRRSITERRNAGMDTRPFASTAFKALP